MHFWKINVNIRLLKRKLIVSKIHQFTVKTDRLPFSLQRSDMSIETR